MFAVVVLLEVVSAVLARHDLAHRDESELRGSKKFWRVFVVMNPGNSVLYWLLGRR